MSLTLRDGVSICGYTPEFPVFYTVLEVRKFPGGIRYDKGDDTLVLDGPRSWCSGASARAYMNRGEIVPTALLALTYNGLLHQVFGVRCANPETLCHPCLHS